MELQDHRKNHRHGMNMYLMGCHRKNSIPFDHNDNFDGSCNAYILSTGTSLAFFQSTQRCIFNGIGKPRLNQVADDGSDCVPLKVSLGERYDYYDPR